MQKKTLPVESKYCREINFYRNKPKREMEGTRIVLDIHQVECAVVLTLGAGATTEWEVLASLAQDLGLVTNTHVDWLQLQGTRRRLLTSLLGVCVQVCIHIYTYT